MSEIKEVLETPHDCVGRQAVLNALDMLLTTDSFEDDINGGSYISYEDAVGEVEALPSVTPKEMAQRGTGKWTNYYDEKRGDWIGECSECGGKWTMDYWLGDPEDMNFYYCPKCGIRMVEVERQGLDLREWFTYDLD